MSTKNMSVSRLIWLSITIVLLIAGIAVYLYLHSIDKGSPYFWTTNDGLLIEVTWWSLFGAFCHIVISNLTEEGITPRLIVFQVMQIIFAPLIAIALFSALYYFSDEGSFDKSFIVFSFVAGMLSGYIMLFLKDAPAISGQKFAVASFPQQERTLSEQPEESYGLKPYSVAVITLELDDAGLFFDEKKEINYKGFSSASVSLQRHGTGDIVNALRLGAGASLSFVADELEQGTYTVRAMQSFRLEDNSMLNLFGERQVDIFEQEVTIRLKVKKMEV